MIDMRDQMKISDVERLLERRGMHHVTAYRGVLLDARILWRCSQCPGEVLRYEDEKTCVACGARRPLRSGELEDEQLTVLGIDEDHTIYEPFEGETLRWLIDLVAKAQGAPGRAGTDEQSYNPFAELGVADVNLTVKDLADDGQLVLVFAVAGGHYIATQPIDQQEFIDDALEGYEVARHALRTAYELVSATLEDFKGQFGAALEVGAS